MEVGGDQRIQNDARYGAVRYGMVRYHNRTVPVLHAQLEGALQRDVTLTAKIECRLDVC